MREKKILSKIVPVLKCKDKKKEKDRKREIISYFFP
jgi:hypothetical protein